MIKDILIYFVLMLLAIFSWELAHAGTSHEEYRRMNANNQAIKDCLLAYGYTGNTLTTGKNFNWQAASSCYADYKQGVMAEEYLKLKFFLEDNPWYKGGNWDWETQAKVGYECIKYHQTGAKICRKPYFRN